jgi:ribosomal protein S18 acetylase RimI-like enzyme
MLMDGTIPDNARMGRAPTSEATIRAATAEDVPSVLELWARGRSLAASLPDDAHSVQRLLERDRSSLLVAELDDRVVGALIAAWDGWRGNMYRLTVEQRHRRSGIGSLLIEAGERLLRKRGARRVSAIVGAGEEAAKALWDSAGYEHDPEVVRFVKNL